MENKNMSDIIESYLHQILAQDQQIEIRRNEIADRFQCVPSQINYVIKTRFTPQRGYAVESKRGGGGYIRIMKLNLVDAADYYDKMMALVGKTINFKDAYEIIENIYQSELITQSEAYIMLSALDENAIGAYEQENDVRAKILKNILLKLKFTKH